MTKKQRELNIPELDIVIRKPYWGVVLRIPKVMEEEGGDKK